MKQHQNVLLPVTVPRPQNQATEIWDGQKNSNVNVNYNSCELQ